MITPPGEKCGLRGEEPSQGLDFRLNFPRQLSQQQAEPLRREARVVLQGKPDIVVAGQDPTVGLLAPVDRVFRAQLVVEGVGVGQPAPAEQSIFVQRLGFSSYRNRILRAASMQPASRRMRNP